MNKCIYYKETNLSFDSREHIIPAGLGGTKKLPSGFVSTKANHFFSDIERVALRETFVGGIRNHIGPGHGGKRLTVSDEGVIQCSQKYKPHINVLKGETKNAESEFSFKLGFMYDKNTVFLPQVLYRVDSNANIINRIYTPGGFDNPKNNVSTFFECLKKIKYNELKSVNTELNFEKLFIMIGCFYDQWFYYSNIPFLGLKQLLEISSRQGDKLDLAISLYSGGKYNYSYKMDGGFIGGELQFIYLKTAFNVLASVMGQEYVLDERFDHVRDLIVGKRKGTVFCESSPCKATRWIASINAKDPHAVLFETIDGALFAVVSFYGELCYTLKMASGIDKRVSFAYVCDWRNRKEYVEKWLE